MIFLFMGGFLIAKGMMVNGLDKRIAYGIMSMKWVGDSPRKIFLAIGLACMLCSGWISNTATAAMMFPADVKHIEGAREFIEKRKNSLGKWTRAQKNTLIAFIVAVILWVLPGILSAVQNIGWRLLPRTASLCTYG